MIAGMFDTWLDALMFGPILLFLGLLNLLVWGGLVSLPFIAFWRVAKEHWNKGKQHGNV